MRSQLMVVALGFVVPLLSAAAALAADPAIPKVVLVKLTTTEGRFVVGELLEAKSEDLMVLDLKTGETLTFAAANVRTVKKPLKESEAIASVGLPALLAWKIKRTVPLGPIAGKIAKLDPADPGAVFATLGAKHGIIESQELAIFRDEDEIKDPDTGKVLGKQRRKIAELTVTDVQDRSAVFWLAFQTQEAKNGHSG